MNTVASTSAIQMPSTSSGGNTSGSVRQGKRHMPQGEHADRRDGEHRKRDHRAPRQDRRGDGHRRQDQDRERVLQPAGQIQQDGELQDVVAEIQRGVALAEPGRATAGARSGRG